jgi:hypothetical protein
MGGQGSAAANAATNTAAQELNKNKHSNTI